MKDTASAVTPFMNQIVTLPDVSIQRMSLEPSPLKSPVSATLHVVGMLPSTDCCNSAPSLMSQIITSPEVLRQRMSEVPSPLKSPVPTTDHVVGMLPRLTPD